MRELGMQGLSGLVEVDSAGTHAFKPGHRPDKRAREVTEKNGVNIRKFKSRMVNSDDFHRFDYILAMDQENLHNLESICPAEYRYKLSLILAFAPQAGSNVVPDPYFGNIEGFERVLALLEVGCKGVADHIRSRYHLAP